MNTFKKTISSLAFNPGMFDQISFYSQRLKQEESIRRLGLVLIVITMFIQIFAALVPAEKSLAASNNDVIYGGIDTIGELRSKYYAKADVRALYNRFGITGGDIEAGNVNNTSFNFQEQGSKGTRTVGRINFGSTQDFPLGPYAGTTFYSRNAAEWQGSTPAYFFGRHKGTDNNYYYVWVLKDCGNIAYRHADTTDVFTPQPPIALPAPTPLPPPVITSAPVATTPQATPTPQEVTCTSLSANTRNGIKSIKVLFSGQYSASPPSIVTGLTFNFGDGTSIRQTSTNAEYTYTNNTNQPVTYSAYMIVHSTIGDKRSSACEVTITVSPEICEGSSTCTAPKRTKRVQNITQGSSTCTAPKRTKRVQNITQGLSSSKTILTKARASDVIEYSLITNNPNAQPVKNYVVEDYIGDLLNYADLDEAFLSSQGGNYSAEKKTITWANQTIPANSEIEKLFRVNLKNPLPSTNQPNATSPDFDCKMQNGYGDEVIIKVDCSVVKTVEELPNTGPGSTLAAAFTLSTLSGYFVARARLLAKELGIIKRGWRS